MAIVTQLFLLAHGSPDPRSARAIRQFAAQIENRVDLPTAVAFLDHNLPDLVTAARISREREEALVLPMLLSTAFHARFDVPRAMAEAGLTRVLPPIGHPIDLLTALIQEAGSYVVLVAAGTTDQGARQLFKEAVEISAIRSGNHAVHAFIAGPGPHLYDQLIAAENSGAGEVRVIPWLLAEGRLLDTLLVESSRAGVSVQGGGLVHEISFIEHIASSIELALCKYDLGNYDLEKREPILNLVNVTTPSSQR